MFIEYDPEIADRYGVSGLMIGGGLFFGQGGRNQKIKKLEAEIGGKILTFSLPAGRTCPGARDCRAWFDGRTLRHGRDSIFDCYAARMEQRLPTTIWKKRVQNMTMIRALRTPRKIAAGLIEGIQRTGGDGTKGVRVHVSGDFFNATYLRAWIMVARVMPSIRFYGYTKSLPILKKVLEDTGLPTNLRLTLSAGGRYDELIPELKEKYGLGVAYVVMSEEEANAKGLELDHNDIHAWYGRQDFALLIHGVQRPGLADRILQARGEGVEL
ncbi:MAG: hypothetical protein D6812_16930 [Deltaproteobacteria bacterium]|nr:MAG: hypothetical protein D6812_16930 [Deltaproteobacteria bacterium]